MPYPVRFQGAELSGKKKKGAETITPDTHMCTVTTTSGESVCVMCPMRGKVLELNPSICDGTVGGGGAGACAFKRGYIAVLSSFGEMPPVGTDLGSYTFRTNPTRHEASQR